LKDDVDKDGERQNMILRMMLAAAASTHKDENLNEDALDLFYNSFNDILEMNNDEEFNKIYTDELKKKLKDTFREILSKGDESEAGYRISVCLLKAQELGVKLPPAIANFSQGQIRLQNTIEEFNEAIKTLSAGLKDLDHMEPGGGVIHIDSNMQVLEFANKRRDGKVKGAFEKVINQIRDVPDEEFKAALLDTRYKEDDVETGERGYDKVQEFKDNYIYGFVKISDRIQDADKKHCGLMERKPGELTAKEMINEYVNKYKENPNLIGTEEQYKEAEKLADKLMFSDVTLRSMEFLGSAENIYVYIPRKLESLNTKDIEDVIEIYDVIIPMAVKLDADIKRLRSLQADNSEEVDNTKEIDELADKITADYKKLKSITSKYSRNSIAVESALVNPNPNFAVYDKELIDMFSEETDNLGAQFKEQYEIIKGIHAKKIDIYKRECEEKEERAKKLKAEGKWREADEVLADHCFKPLPEDEKDFGEAIKKFIDLHTKISAIQIKKYYDTMYKDAEESSIKEQDFNSVMKDVFKTNLASDDGSVSYLKMLAFGARFKNFTFLNKVRKNISF
ncbi:MAG: hypothetical protein J6N76_10890, partial [Lachnospiraceae bacterium]|nr:hypothetical protein [Lachnospiraceae bacterium]